MREPGQDVALAPEALQQYLPAVSRKRECRQLQSHLTARAAVVMIVALGQPDLAHATAAQRAQQAIGTDALALGVQAVLADAAEGDRAVQRRLEIYEAQPGQGLRALGLGLVEQVVELGGESAQFLGVHWGSRAESARAIGPTTRPGERHRETAAASCSLIRIDWQKPVIVGGLSGTVAGGVAATAGRPSAAAWPCPNCAARCARTHPAHRRSRAR